MTLSSPSNATIATGTGTVTIGASGASAVTNPGISAPPNVVVGETDGYIDLPVTLSAPGINTVSVNYTTANGSGETRDRLLLHEPRLPGPERHADLHPRCDHRGGAGAVAQLRRQPLDRVLHLLPEPLVTSGASLLDGGTQIDVTGDAPGELDPGPVRQERRGRRQRRHGPGPGAPRRPLGSAQGSRSRSTTPRPTARPSRAPTTTRRVAP